MEVDEERGHVFVEMAASSFAAYCERCGLADEPWVSARASMLLRRCCGVVGATECVARKCLSSARLTCTVGERGLGNETNDFVLVYTSEKVLIELGKKQSNAAKEYIRSAVSRVICLEIADGCYDAPTRAVLKGIIYAMSLEWRPVAALEAKAFANSVKDAAAQADTAFENDTFEEHAVMVSKEEATPRLWVRVSVAAVGGGALLALTGGAAAPSLAASIIGATNAEGVAMCITGFFASLGAGVSGLKARRRFASGQDFRLETLRVQAAPGIASFILVPGWREPGRDAADAFGGGETSSMTTTTTTIRTSSSDNEHKEESRGSGRKKKIVVAIDEDDLSQTWEQVLPMTTETYVEHHYDWWRDHVPYAHSAQVVVWESRALERLYQTMLETNVWVQARDRAARSLLDEILRRSAFGAAALPLALLDRAAALDDPWTIAISRAKKAGERLADHLLQPLQATPAVVDDQHLLSSSSLQNPITLVGYSIGARVVMHCLEALDAYATQHRDPRALGLVENVVLLGAPLAARHQRWLQARRVVAGRLINGYSTRDWMLKLVYRSKAWSLCGVAGAEPVRAEASTSAASFDPSSVPAIENTDLSDLVNGHLSYPHVMPQIFHRLQLE